MSASTDNSDHIIVWLDQNVASPNDCQNLKKAFFTTIDPENELPTKIDDKDILNLIHEEKPSQQSDFNATAFVFKLFDDIEKCHKFLLANAGKKRIFFITSGSFGQYIVPKLLSMDPGVFQDKNGKFYEHSIYIFCADMALHSRWAEEFLDLNCIQMYSDERAVLSRLARDIANDFVSKGEEEWVKDNIEAVKKACQYFTWARTLHTKAESVQKGGLNNDLLGKLDQLIEKAEQRIKELEG
ncbi:unnamed protein product [Rotaria sp. Silwood1]|nr:unnamed protein product [Rotaria sp. Silwood1]